MLGQNVHFHRRNSVRKSPSPKFPLGPLDFLTSNRTYALGFDRKIKDELKHIGGHTNPEWRLDEFESPEMHEQKFCGLSDIDVSSLLMHGSISVFARRIRDNSP